MSRRQPADVQDVHETQRPLTARTRLRINRQHFESAFPTVSSPTSRRWPATAVASSGSTSLPVPPRTTRRKRANSVPLSPPLDHDSKRRRKTDRLSPSPSDSLAYNCQVTVACKTPPINLQSMRSLDARHVLQDPQIRHDGLFDSIGFLPASSFQPASVLPCSALAPQLVLEARIRDITSEMYWESVRAELRDGCRCTRWVVPKDASWPHGLAIDRRVKMRDCICGKWMTDKSERQWVKAQHDNIYASRLPALFSSELPFALGTKLSVRADPPSAPTDHRVIDGEHNTRANGVDVGCELVFCGAGLHGRSSHGASSAERSRPRSPYSSGSPRCRLYRSLRAPGRGDEATLRACAGLDRRSHDPARAPRSRWGWLRQHGRRARKELRLP